MMVALFASVSFNGYHCLNFRNRTCLTVSFQGIPSSNLKTHVKLESWLVQKSGVFRPIIVLVQSHSLVSCVSSAYFDYMLLLAQHSIHCSLSISHRSLFAISRLPFGSKTNSPSMPLISCLAPRPCFELATI